MKSGFRTHRRCQEAKGHEGLEHHGVLDRGGRWWVVGGGWWVVVVSVLVLVLVLLVLGLVLEVVVIVGRFRQGAA